MVSGGPGLAGIVLAAGAGTRLRPLTELLPKALCPVDNTPLLDLALARVRPHADGVAVNVHHGRKQMLDHLEGRDVHVEVEPEVALGTAGGVANLRGWIDGRDVLVCNADAWGTDPLDRLVAGWSRETVRLLVTPSFDRADFEDQWQFAGVSLTPWEFVRDLSPEPSGLYEVLWGRLEKEGRLELMPTVGVAIDCGSPRDYLMANLIASGGQTVVGAGAVVAGRAERSVLWPDARVEPDEHLRYAIRAGDGTTVHVGLT